MGALPSLMTWLLQMDALAKQEIWGSQASKIPKKIYLGLCKQSLWKNTPGNMGGDKNF